MTFLYKENKPSQIIDFPQFIKHSLTDPVESVSIFFKTSVSDEGVRRNGGMRFSWKEH
jgi:hypothetical protein